MISRLQQFIKKTSYKPDLLLIIFAFFLPVFSPVSQIAIAIYLIFWVHNKQFRFLYKIKSNWFSIGAIAYFLIFALSGFYSSNLPLWSADLEAKAPFLIFSLLLISREKYDENILKTVFWAFAGGCLLCISFLYYEYFFGTYDYYLDIGRQFRLIMFVNPFLNAIYFAMYLSSIFLIGVYAFFSQERIEFNRKTIFQILGLLFIQYIVFILASRMSIFVMIIVISVLIFLWQFIFKKRYIKGIISVIAVVLISLLALTSIKSVKMRMPLISSDVRISMWEASFIQLAKSPIIGYGSGDARSVMNEGYKIINYEHGLEHNHNCHNQYLETMISTGLVGLLILLGWFLLAFRMGWQTQNYMLCIFLAIIALNILTESMFERQQGTYFIAFFGNLLTWKSFKRNNSLL